MRLYLILFFLSSLNLLGQAPVDTKIYLNNKQVSRNAKDFYKGKFVASDETKTFSILDSLNTKNDLTRPFYIYLVSTMLDRSDGALSEALGISCKAFVEQHPDHLINFLYSDNKLVDKKYIGKWADAIAGELIIDGAGQEKQCIKGSLRIALAKTKAGNKSKLTRFYSIVKTYINTPYK